MKNIYLSYILGLMLTFSWCGMVIADTQFTVSGTVKDGLTNQALPDAKVYLTIQSYTQADKQKIEYSARTATDTEGKYQFEVGFDSTSSNNPRFLKLLVAAKGYIGTIDIDRLTAQLVAKNIQHNFALLAEGKEATIKGTVRDVVTRAPLSNIPVELSLLESDYQAGTYIQKNKELRKLITDTNGIYETNISSDYVDRIKSTHHWRTNIQFPDYEIAVVDYGATGNCCSRDTTKAETEQETNLAINAIDYYLVSKKTNGKLEGTLLTPNNQPVSQAKIRIEIATGGGAMSMAEGGFG